MTAPVISVVVLSGHDEPVGAARTLAQTLALPETVAIVPLDGSRRESGRASWFHPGGDRSSDRAIEAACDYLETQVKALAVDGRRVVVVGHSQGAAIGMLTCLSSSLPVDRLVLIGGFVVDCEARRMSRSDEIEALVVRGRYDDVVSIDAHEHLVRTLQRRLPRVAVVVHDGGHEPSPSLGPLVREFLNDL